MGRTFQSATIGILTMLCIFTVAAHASASVSNPGSFDFNIEPGHDSLFRFKSGQQILIDGSGTSYISANIDSNGDFSGVSGAFSSAIMPNSGTPISALLQLQSGSGGVIVPQTADLEFVLKFRVRFSYNGSAACTTDEFSVRLDTSTWASSGAGACSTGYTTTNGDFCVVSTGFTVPVLPASACGSHGNDINTALSLGTSSQTRMQILLGSSSAVIQP